MIETIKEWRFKRQWKKKYHQEIPDWYYNFNPNKPFDTFNGEEFVNWLSLQSDDIKNEWAEKIQILSSGYERLFNGVEDEMISRGIIDKPEVDNVE